MSKFEPNFKIINEHLDPGDFGIAKKLNDDTVKSILSSIEDEEVKKKFIELSQFPYMNGNWAMERTILSSMMEVQKAVILYSISLLKIFGELEFTKVKFTSGQNPETRPNDYLPTYRRLLKTMPIEYRQIFSSSNNKLPRKILLGKYHENGTNLNPTTEEKSGKIWIGHWPQFTSANQYEQVQINDLKNKIKSFQDKQFKEELISNRRLNINAEYAEIDSGAAIKKLSIDKFPSSKNKAYQPQVAKNQDNLEVMIDIEQNYDLTSSFVEVQEGTDPAVKVKHFTINATLKQEVTDELNNILINRDGTKKNQPTFLAGDFQLGTLSYISRLLPVVLKDGIDSLVNLSLAIADNNRIVGEAVSDRLLKNYEFMDPNIKNLDEDSELKKTYYSSNKMIFDGQTRFQHELLDINFKIENAIPSFELGSDIESDPQLRFINTILNFMSMPVNMYKEILNVHKDLMKDLMSYNKIVNTYNKFPKMEWLKDLVIKEKLLSFLGSEDGEIYTTKLFDPVARDWDKSITDKGKAFYEELINKYIEQLSAIFSVDLKKIDI